MKRDRGRRQPEQRVEGEWEEPDWLYLELSDCNSEILLGVAVSASERGQSKAS